MSTTIHRDLASSERHPPKDHNHTATEDGGTLSGAVVNDFLVMTEASAPSTPAAGKVRLFAKSSKRLYYKNSAGVETAIVPSGTVFPISPANGDAFVKEDSGLTTQYKTAAANWLGGPYAPVINTDFSVPISVTTIFAALPMGASDNFWIDNVEVICEVQITNDGTNYWNLSLRKLDGTSVGVVDTALDSPDTTLHKVIDGASITPNPVSAATSPVLLLKAEPVGTPGDLIYVYVTARVRDVIT